jgi:hypothetical protein
MTLDILSTPFSEIKGSFPDFTPVQPYVYPRPRGAVMLAVYRNFDDVHAAGLGEWAPYECHCTGPFELLVKFQKNNVLLYKLRCRECGRSGGAIAHANVPWEVRVRRGEEFVEPNEFGNGQWAD